MSVRVALTFDAEVGSFPRHSIGPIGWRLILDLLKSEGIRATFFVTGEWADQHPELTRRTAAEGHLLGNHTLHHLRLGERRGEIQHQLDAADAIISGLIPGMTTKPWMRLPGLHGDGDPAVLAAVEATGYEHVRVNVDARDWDFRRYPTARSVAEKVSSECAGRDPIVILMHTWPRTTPDALRLVIDHLRDRGAEFVTVADLTDQERQALPGRVEQPVGARPRAIRWATSLARQWRSTGRKTPHAVVGRGSD